MAFLTIQHVKISGIAASVPSTKVSSDDLSGFERDEITLLKETTGIHFRRIATEHQTAAELCLAAAEPLLNNLKCNRSEIEILVFVTQTPTQKVPGDASQLQQKLGLSNQCMVLDINQGCSAYVYGLSIIAGMITSGRLKKGLLLVGDTITKTLDPKDKATIPIFSDAGSATLLEFDEKASPIYFNLQSNGLKFKAIFQTHEGNLRMNGHEVFYFGASEVPQNVNALLDYAKTDVSEIDFFVFHQANHLLNESIRRKLKLDKKKVPSSLKDFGNTSCATIPLTLANNLAIQLKTKNRNYMLSGFGVGLSWASAILKIDRIACMSLIEV